MPLQKTARFEEAMRRVEEAIEEEESIDLEEVWGGAPLHGRESA